MTDHPRHPTLDHLEPLVGEWTLTATHRLLPGDVIHGRATFEWLNGYRFLIWRTHYDHPDIPDSISIIGAVDRDDADASGGAACVVQYFDSRGVYRQLEIDAEPGVWRTARNSPGFSQRFTGRFSDDGDTITGLSELCEDGTTWMEDLPITYTRVVS